MHCHETLKVQLQLLLNELKSKEWTQNCTETGREFINNWGGNWQQKLPEGFVSEQPFLIEALGQLVAHDDVDDASLGRALRAVSYACAGDHWLARFLSTPQDRQGRAIEITAEVASLFEDMAPIVLEIESMLLNPVYCPQNVALRVLLARLNAGMPQCISGSISQTSELKK